MIVPLLRSNLIRFYGLLSTLFHFQSVDYYTTLSVYIPIYLQGLNSLFTFKLNVNLMLILVRRNYSLSPTSHLINLHDLCRELRLEYMRLFALTFISASRVEC